MLFVDKGVFIHKQQMNVGRTRLTLGSLVKVGLVYVRKQMNDGRTRLTLGSLV